MKAEELIKKFLRNIPHISYWDSEEEAKKCALICVDETLIAELKVIENISEYLPIDIYTQAVIFHKGRAQKVKEEIKN